MTEEYLYRSLKEAGVPEHDHCGIVRYVLHGIEPGGFLTAVITNNLKESMGKADLENRRALFNIVSWFYNHAPADCWGSAARMSAWIIARRGLDGVKEVSTHVDS
jgi:hypothetical protein